jgi:hypothetical protein
MIKDTTQVLSDTSMEKVCLIKDISNLLKMLFDDPITDSHSFDSLYDMEILELEMVMEKLIAFAEFRTQAKSLANLVFEIERNKRKNNEEGD